MQRDLEREEDQAGRRSIWPKPKKSGTKFVGSELFETNVTIKQWDDAPLRHLWKQKIFDSVQPGHPSQSLGNYWDLGTGNDEGIMPQNRSVISQAAKDPNSLSEGKTNTSR